MKKKSDASPIFSLLTPPKANDSSIWLSTTLKLYRNLSNFHFPGKLSAEERKQVLDLTKTAILTIPDLEEPTLIHAQDASPVEKEYLYEHFLSMHGFHQAHAGEAFVIDKSSSFLGVLNIRDHLQLQVSDISGEIEAAWNRALQMEKHLSQSLKFAYSDRYGFLTADPSLCGTGLVILTFLQLPALIHTGQLPTILTKHRMEGVESTGLQGDANNLIGDVIVLYNNYTLGLTEEDIATTVRSAVTRLFIEEKSARARIRDSGDGNLKDAVSRAFGLLNHSYQIETVEALGSVSLLKLGLDLGWIKGTDMANLNKLFRGCRRGHLLAGKPGSPSPEEVLHLRAETVHKALKNVSLTI